MKYSELYQRIQTMFPDLSEGMFKAYFNDGSKTFQRDTYLGITTQITVPYTAFSTGSCDDYDVIMLESVSIDNSKLALVYVDNKDLSGEAVNVANELFYFIKGNEITLCQSNSDGELSLYAPTSNVVLTGKFINTDNLITDTTTENTEFNDSLALALLFYIYASIYKLNPEKLELAKFYENEFNLNLRKYRKEGLSAKRPETVQMRGL